MSTEKAHDPSLPDTSTSSELRNYHLNQRIGQEELATIYGATHLMLDRPVEVHILRRTDWVSASRFQLAARLAARLSHPNLLPVIDAGHDDQFGNYLVTPTLDAQPLNVWLNEDPLEPMPALRVITQITAVLDYLHGQNIVHRDIQPANILMTAQGIAYLTGLGLASSPDTPDLSSVDEADYLTPYSAPEQRLDQNEASPALDIYGLGAVLYHMLSGEIPPPPGTETPSLTQRDPELARVDPVIRRMLAVDPKARPETAGAALNELRTAMRVQIDQASEDMEESRWEPVAQWLENPLETVLNTVLDEQAIAEQAADEAADEQKAVTALHNFQEFVTRSHMRADVLHRADTIRRLLNRWSRQGTFRRQLLGQVIQLEQIVSYNLYFYELRTLYETRTQPEKRQRLQREDDQRATMPSVGVWEAEVPGPPPVAFADVKAQELVLPNSTYIFACPTCGSTGQITCQKCGGTGLVEQPRKVSNPDHSTAEETISETCNTCHGYGRVKCETCAGTGDLVEEAVFSWSRRARLWQNTDDIEDLPHRALREHTRPVCATPIDLYQGHWHSVAPLDELLRAAVKDIKDGDTRIVAAELRISGVPMTEVDYKLNERSERLYLIGEDSEVVGNWTLLNPERIALVVGSGVVIAVLVLVVLFTWVL